MTPTHVLDTDHFALFTYGAQPLTGRVLAAQRGAAVSVITVDEVLGGWYAALRRSNQPEHLEMVYEQLARSAVALGLFPILTMRVPAILRAEQLVRLKLGVRKPDLRIAAIALNLGAKVATRNLRDFGRVPGLASEDWSA